MLMETEMTAWPAAKTSLLFLNFFPNNPTTINTSITYTAILTHLFRSILFSPSSPKPHSYTKKTHKYSLGILGTRILRWWKPQKTVPCAPPHTAWHYCPSYGKATRLFLGWFMKPEFEERERMMNHAYFFLLFLNSVVNRLVALLFSCLVIIWHCQSHTDSPQK